MFRDILVSHVNLLKPALTNFSAFYSKNRFIQMFSIALLFILIAFGTIGGCGGGGDGSGNGDDENLITIAEISFASAGRFGLDNLSFNPLLTFDEPEFSPPGPIDGKTVQGVTFSFTVDGVQSTDAAVGLSTGPGTTPLVTPPIIEGDAAGLLVLIFEPPVNSVNFDFGLDTFLEDIDDASTISIFDENDNLLGTASADAIVPEGFLFPEGTLGINSDGQKLNAAAKQDSLINSQNHLSDIDDFGVDWWSNKQHLYISGG